MGNHLSAKGGAEEIYILNLVKKSSLHLFTCYKKWKCL